jgi:hypothetical protein
MSPEAFSELSTTVMKYHNRIWKSIFFQTLCTEVFYEGHYKEHNFFKVEWYY